MANGTKSPVMFLALAGLIGGGAWLFLRKKAKYAEGDILSLGLSGEYFTIFKVGTVPEGWTGEGDPGYLMSSTNDPIKRWYPVKSIDNNKIWRRV